MQTMNDEKLLAELEAYLAPPERAPDVAFVARVRRAVVAEEHAREASAMAWRRFKGELAGTAAVLAACIGFASTFGSTIAGMPGVPMGARELAALVVGIWLVAIGAPRARFSMS
jgi:hypothetical protein